MVCFQDYIDEKAVIFFDSCSKEEVVEALVDRVYQTRDLPGKEQFYAALLEREALVSTAIGMGVAIPHAKLPVYSDFFMAVGILGKGIDWNAIDDSLVRIVFLIGGPDNRQTDYLKLLSSITIAMRDENLRKRLMASETPGAVLTLLRGAK